MAATITLIGPYCRTLMVSMTRLNLNLGVSKEQNSEYLYKPTTCYSRSIILNCNIELERRLSRSIQNVARLNEIRDLNLLRGLTFKGTAIL